MSPVRTVLLGVLLAAGMCTGPASPAYPSPGEDPAPPPAPPPGGSAFTGASPAGDPARSPAIPPPPSPLPARDPARLSVELRAAGPRRACVLGAARGRLAEEAGSAGPGRVLRDGAKLSVRIEAGPGGTLRVDGVAASVPRIRFDPAPDPGAAAAFTLDGQSYPGSLRVSLAVDGTLRLVDDCPLEDYLCGVLAGELFPDSPPEALRALAVLARSFALSHLPDLSDDPGLHQAFKGVPPASVLPVLRQAVAATAGLRLVDGRGGPLPNYWYHSTCGGHTADASLVFGAPQTEAYSGVPCSRCTASKYWQWEVEVPERDLRRALRFGSAVARLEIGSRSIDGRVLTFRATAAGGTVKYVPAIQVRQALGVNRVRSTLVTALEPLGEGAEGPGRTATPRAFRIAGRGWGHGVGLCQVGACALAKDGWTAERILGYYYPGTKVVRATR